MSKLLLIDDSPTELEVMRLHLTSAGFTVVTLAKCVGTLLTVVREKPDLILVDITMPLMEGPSLVRLIHQLDPERAAIPIILHSSLPEDEMKQRTAECGAQGYLRKSWPLALKIDTIRNHLSAAESSR